MCKTLEIKVNFAHYMFTCRDTVMIYIPEHLIPTLLTGEQEVGVSEQSSKDAASAPQRN